MILDEPTNDLDIETLELLEEVVANYAGTVILVSHDRDFVNNSVNSCLYFDGSGNLVQVVGGYDDLSAYLQDKAAKEAALKSVGQTKEKAAKKNDKEQSRNSNLVKKKLSYKDSRELAALPELIETLESELEQLQEEVNTPEFLLKVLILPTKN